MNALSSSQSDTQVGAVTAAPVLDYACLFSHDLKRKQKRWQDGRLKFHCFNKRVMVYDERGNFIGDMHWTMDHDFDEGEEFQLERGCVIVQVSECLGRKEQDLSALIDKRYKDKEERQAHAAAAAATKPFRPAPTPHRPPMPVSRPATDIATPRANQLGRAVLPQVSPFEQRNLNAQGAHQQDEKARPAKRRKPELSPPSKSGYARSLFGAPLALSAFTSSASQQSHATLSQPCDTRAAKKEPFVPRSRTMPSLLKVQSAVLADTPSKPPKTANESNHTIVPDSSPALDSVLDDGKPAEPRVNPPAAAHKRRSNADWSFPKSLHQSRYLAEENEPARSAVAVGEVRKPSPRLVAKEGTLLQTCKTKRTSLLSVARKRAVPATSHEQLESPTAATTDPTFPAADTQSSIERTSLIASTKRTKKRGLMIASEKTKTSKRCRNVADEPDQRPAKSTRSSRGNGAEVTSTENRRRKVSAGLMFDDEDVIDISDDASSASSKNPGAEPVETITKTAIPRLTSRAVKRTNPLTQMHVAESKQKDAETSDEDNGFRRRVRSKRASSPLEEAVSDVHISASSSIESSSPQPPVEAPCRKRAEHQQDRPQQVVHNRPHLATLRRSVKSKEIIGFYGSANSSREAAVLARMRESTALTEAEEERAMIEQARMAEAKKKEVAEERLRQEQLRAEEARQRETQEAKARGEAEEAERQRQLLESHAREEARKEKMAMEAREREAREKVARKKEAREEELSRQQAREREAREKEAWEEEKRRQEIRERESREQKTREEDLRQQLIREREAHDRETHERRARAEEEQRQRELHEKQSREREARERDAKEKEEQEREALAREAREREAREAEDREMKAREREARLEAREKEAQEREARLEAWEQENRLKEAREKEACEKQAQADENRHKYVKEKARLPKFVPPTRPSKLGVAVRASLSRGASQTGSGDGDSIIVGASTNVVNPATRSRKAAEKSHATGQLSRAMIPVADTSIAADRRPMVSGQGQSTTPNTTMPGFTRVNGGPWSIQAHDLLGIGRPS